MAQPLPAPPSPHAMAPRPLVFPTEAMVPESKEHLDLRTALYLVLRHLYAPTMWIGSDQFVYFDAGDPTRVLAPDIFVRRGGPDERFASWKTWERGAPELAIEIVSESDAPERAWQKKLASYRSLGVEELVRFEPGADAPLRVWDRLMGDLVERIVPRDEPIEVACRVLGCALRSVGRELRLVRDGVVLATPDERADAEAAKARRLRAKLVAAGIDPEE